MQPIWTIVRPLAFALTLLVACSGCEDVDDLLDGPSGPELPPATRTGQRTFGFKYGDDQIFEGSLVQGVFYRDALQITTNQKWSSHGDARIVIDQYRGEDTLILDNLGVKDSVPQRQFVFVTDNGRYSTNGPHTVKVVIHKFNTVEGVVSGIFSGSVINKHTKDTIQITEGRFDATM